MEGLLGNVKNVINYALCLAHYDAYFHINDDAKHCRYLSVTNIILYFLIIHVNYSHMKYYKKYALPWIHQ